MECGSNCRIADAQLSPVVPRALGLRRLLVPSLAVPPSLTILLQCIGRGKYVISIHYLRCERHPDH